MLILLSFTTNSSSVKAFNCCHRHHRHCFRKVGGVRLESEKILWTTLKVLFFFLRIFHSTHTHTPIFSHSFHRFDPSTNRTQPSDQSCFIHFFFKNFSHKENIVGDDPVQGSSVPLVKHFCSYIFIVAFIFIWTSSLRASLQICDGCSKGGCGAGYTFVVCFVVFEIFM